MQNFTPYSALIGGALIGLSAAILMLFNGRIAGISGILAGIVTPKAGDVAWRYCFIAGLLLGPWLFAAFGLPLPDINIAGPWWQWLLAGVLVGFGTQLGSGCTSGHGVCGLARLSLRSLTATLTFMGVALVTVFIMRHLL